MYLPLSPTLLRCFQFLFSRLHHKDYNDFATLSPYHDAPQVPGVSGVLPGDCTVDQVVMLHRHGSRGPVFEDEFILGLVGALEDAQDTIRATPLPPELEFLKKGYQYRLVPQELTIVGRRELFDHGVEFALRYPDFSTDIVVSSPVQRVVDSSYFFAQGFFGLGTENVTFRTVQDLDDPVSWITPWKSCPRFSDREAHKTASRWVTNYVSPIAERLGKRLPGMNLSVNNTRGALYACPFDLAAGVQAPWCNVFSIHELQNLEYEYDLLMDGITGHASRGDHGALLGAFYVKKLIERLTNATGDAKPLYLEFGHDTSILLPLSTMRLNKSAVILQNEFLSNPLLQGHFTSRPKFKYDMGEIYMQKVLRGPPNPPRVEWRNISPLYLREVDEGQEIWIMFAQRIREGKRV